MRQEETATDFPASLRVAVLVSAQGQGRSGRDLQPEGQEYLGRRPAPAGKAGEPPGGDGVLHGWLVGAEPGAHEAPGAAALSSGALVSTGTCTTRRPTSLPVGSN